MTKMILNNTKKQVKLSEGLILKVIKILNQRLKIMEKINFALKNNDWNKFNRK